MYDSLSEQSKCFFHPGFLGFENISFNWLLAQFALSASSFSFLKKILLRVYPFAALLSVVSTTSSGTIIGFAFIKRKSHNLIERSVGELGICVIDAFQQKHVGSGLLKSLVSMARNEQFHRIYLTVIADNLRAIRLYEKNGFRKTRDIPEGDQWQGKQFGSYELSLYLN